MFKKVLYLHGIGSTGGGNTVSMLRNRFPGMEVISPELPTSPKKAFEFIQSVVNNERFDAVIGTSLGGFYAMMISGIPKVLVNPAMFASTDITRAIGYGKHEYLKKRMDGETFYTVDDAYVSELRDLEKRYFDFWKDDEYVYETRAIFGTADTVVSHINDFKKYFDVSKMVVDNFGHRMTSEVFNKTFVPFMEKIYADVSTTKPCNFLNY